MIHILLFGTGCDLCREIAANIDEAVSRCGCDARFEKSSDLHRMLSLGVQSTPSVLIDGSVVSVSRSLEVEEIISLIESNCAKIENE
jgi:small redox-active disulfide protein 2